MATRDGFGAADLFNACPGGSEPPAGELEQFASIEVSGVRDTGDGEEGETTCATCDDAEAEFWTVYARHHRDQTGIALCYAITDAPTRERAEAIARNLSIRWGLPFTV